MKHKCNHCKYEWEARVRKPKCCPACKRYLPLFDFQISAIKKEEETDEKK